MKGRKIAARYAKALYAVAKEASQVEQVLNELRGLAGAVAEDRELMALLRSPLVRNEDVHKSVQKAMGDQSLSEVGRSFLELVARNGRAEHLPEMAEAFQQEVDLANGIVRGQVTSPAPLRPEERTQIESFISRVAGRKAILEYKQDPYLLGGLLATVGSYSFDDSLETQMRLLKDHVNKGAF